MAKCRSCDAPIMWAKTKAGKSIPIDADTSAGWDQPVLDSGGNLRPTGDTVSSKFGPMPVVAFIDRTAETALIRRKVRAATRCPTCDAPFDHPCLRDDGRLRESNHEERARLAIEKDESITALRRSRWRSHFVTCPSADEHRSR